RMPRVERRPSRGTAFRSERADAASGGADPLARRFPGGLAFRVNEVSFAVENRLGSRRNGPAFGRAMRDRGRKPTPATERRGEMVRDARIDRHFRRCRRELTFARADREQAADPGWIETVH